MPTLTIAYESITEKDYDEVDETVKQCRPSIDGVELQHCYTRDNSETDAVSEAAIRADLTDKGYTFDP